MGEFFLVLRVRKKRKRRKKEKQHLCKGYSVAAFHLNYKMLLKLSFGKETKSNLGGVASTVWNFCAGP